MIQSSVIGASFPSLTAASASLDAAASRTIIRRTTALLLLLMGPPCAVLGVGAHPMLAWWLGKEIADSTAALLQILVAGAFISSFAGVAVAVLQASGRPEVVTRLRARLAVPFFLLQCWAVARWGVVGAAWGALARSTIETAAMIAAAHSAGRT